MGLRTRLFALRWLERRFGHDRRQNSPRRKRGGHQLRKPNKVNSGTTESRQRTKSDRTFPDFLYNSFNSANSPYYESPLVVGNTRIPFNRGVSGMVIT